MFYRPSEDQIADWTFPCIVWKAVEEDDGSPSSSTLVAEGYGYTRRQNALENTYVNIQVLYRRSDAQPDKPFFLKVPGRLGQRNFPSMETGFATAKDAADAAFNSLASIGKRLDQEEKARDDLTRLRAFEKARAVMDTRHFFRENQLQTTAFSAN